MLLIDVNTYIGGYPFRHVPHPEPEALVKVMAREGIARAWVGHLPSAFHRDPTGGNAELFARLAPFTGQLAPVPAVRPDWPEWEATLDDCLTRGAVAVRAYPQLWGLSAGDQALRTLAMRCAQRRCPLILTARFEDVRQRHLLDIAPDLSAAHIRELARAGTGAALVVTAASRELIEEVHWGLTSAERARVFWDISWLWGPPSDECSHLFRTVGASRFLFGTMWPLRLAQHARANLELAETDVADLPLGSPEELFGSK